MNIQMWMYTITSCVLSWDHLHLFASSSVESGSQSYHGDMSCYTDALCPWDSSVLTLSTQKLE